MSVTVTVSDVDEARNGVAVVEAAPQGDRGDRDAVPILTAWWPGLRSWVWERSTGYKQWAGDLGGGVRRPTHPPRPTPAGSCGSSVTYSDGRTSSAQAEAVAPEVVAAGPAQCAVDQHERLCRLSQVSMP